MNDLSQPELRVTRRRFLIASALTSFTTYALLREARGVASTTSVGTSARRWISWQQELAIALRNGTISDAAWCGEVRRIASDVDVEQLMAEVRLRSGNPHRAAPTNPMKRVVGFVDDEGQRVQLSYATATFSFSPDSVIAPHGHKYMASAHLVVEGKVRVRTFDRLKDTSDSMTIRPRADHVAGVGSVTAMTPGEANVHWFTPASPSAATFDVIIVGLNAENDQHSVDPIDPLNGRIQEDGTIVAPLLTVDESVRKYTATM